MKHLALSVLAVATLSISSLAVADSKAEEASFMKNFNSEFMNACTAQGAPADLCKCAMDNVTAKISYSELKSMEDGTATADDQKKIIEKLQTATMECLPK